MENFSHKYAEVQMQLLNLEKAIVAYEDGAQNESESQKLIKNISETFQNFCDLLAEYLKVHHKNFASASHPREIIENAHKAGFLAEHDSKLLLRAIKEKDSTLASHKEVSTPSHAVRPHLENIAPIMAEIPLIHNIETYIETIQTIMREIKP